MAKIIKFDPSGKEPEKDKKTSGEKKEPTLLKTKRENAQPLTDEDLEKLFPAFREGLKELYPSQVEDVLGITALGEKNGENAFMVGKVVWKRYGVKQPYISTFVAYFGKGKLKKISFLEAKNNYWDWKTILKVHKGEFHTEEIFNRFMELVNNSFLT
jgi:hypothetical protein